MRIAFCISGQPRNLKDVSVLWKSLYVPNARHHIDTFAWFWSSDTYPAEYTKRHLPNLLPTRIAIEPELEQLVHEGQHWWRRSSINSMTYAILQANDLRRSFETETGARYDCVVRLRSDINFLTPIPFSDLPLESGCVYLPRPEGDGYSWNGLCDWFAYGRPEAMDHYSGWYDSLSVWIRRGLHTAHSVLHGFYGVPERMLLHHLSEGNLESVGIIGEIGVKNWRFANYAADWQTHMTRWDHAYGTEDALVKWKASRKLE
jgi:hypothetical protein